MATLALSLAGQFVGGMVGGPLGATVGRALGALAGSAVDGLIFGEHDSAPANDIRLQGSSEGGAIPRLYGWNRLSGNIIWARELELLDAEGAGAKGFGQSGEDEVGASFAVAFCEGTVHRLGRIWADGQLLDPDGLTLRFYRGTDDQLPDGLIEATQGFGNAPAYRGVCYLVFEQLPLSRFGNRIPQISVELCRVVGDLEPAVTAVTIIPGATEWGYDPTPRVRVVGKGQTQGENTHVATSTSDWTLSLDELQDLCPNLQHVSLVVAWFGDDLRCGSCTLGPRTEHAERTIAGATWSVAGLGRADVPAVSTHGGGPAYGGTPSDSAVLAAIADLKARGLKVTLYPIVLMDIPDGNTLADPYSDSGAQASYPWRGRITCFPAPGRVGTPDRTAAVDTQVSAFAAQYRAMIRHYAQLAEAAGGIDALLLGSEMVGVTTLRGVGNAFPFVQALVTLAAEVRGIVGVGTKLSYGADWSEYSGYQNEGEKFFHLDPLWASPDIDAVGIDNYFPISDWRDGLDHADVALADSPYEADYLQANIAGGEGFDWYYATAADRVDGTRTPITDGEYDEPWVWRFKDVRTWWSQAHHDRPGGVRAATSTAWVPGGKPIWFTELGCGAVDKGANQPNVFSDPKSAESGQPFFSNGTPDALAQRQFIRAHQKFWTDPANNPVGMVDTDRIYLWTWDARPYPAFPVLGEVWADGANHATGHWLSGRLGAAASDELAMAIADDFGVTLGEVSVSGLVIEGYRLGQAMSCRDALEPVLKSTGLVVRDSGAIDLVAPGRIATVAVAETDLVATDKLVLARRRGDPGAATGRLAISFADRQRDYQTETVTAMRRADGALAAESSDLVLPPGGARIVAERLLAAAGQELETIDLVLPPSLAALEVGDLLSVQLQTGGPFLLVEMRDGITRSVTARSLPNPEPIATVIATPRGSGVADFAASLPELAVAHLPPVPGDDPRSRLVVAAYAKPWPGRVTLTEAGSGKTVADLRRRGNVGELGADLATGPTGVWDRANVVDILLYAGHPATAEPGTVLNGTNRLAVMGEEQEWEIIGFATAELVAPGHYRLSNLLRGLGGTTPATAHVGRPVVLLDSRTTTIPVPSQWLGETLALCSFAGASDLTGTDLTVTAGLAPVLPLAPVHLRATRVAGGDVVIRWTRRSRADDDGWAAGDAPLDCVPERYVVTVFAGTPAVRRIEVGEPSCLYALADQVADFGTMPAGFSFQIAQVSPVFGPGHAAGANFHD